MKAKMKGVLGAMKPATQNQACMWSEPDIVGWLDKRGGKFKSWKKRFFVLQGSYLFYFENDFKVQAKNPLGVIPLDASKVDMKNEESGDASRRYTFNICLGKQFLGYSKRDTYVVAAPSRQALEEWVQRIKTAAEARDVLLDQLRKARWRGGDLRRLLANSMGNREMLDYGASNPEGQALVAEFMKVQESIGKLQEDVVRLESQANHEEGALMRAMVVWDILNQYLTGKCQAGEHSLAQRRIIIEKEAVQQLYRMFQTKGNYFQGQDIEYLGKEAREKLRSKVEHSLYLVQERQAKIRSKAPRYSFNLNPNIFEDEGESLQQEFQLDTEASQPAALKFYKNIQAEVMETAEQLKNLKTTALRVAGIEERGQEGIDRVLTSEGNERSYDNRMVTNSNMLADMMRRRGEPARDFSVQDTVGNPVVEGTTKAWLQNQWQEQWIGMQDQVGPPQPSQNWPQQNQVRGVRPLPESFVPPQSQFPGGSQLSQPLVPLQSQMPVGRPFSQSQLPGMRPSPAPFVQSPLQIPYGPTGPGPLSQSNARPMNQTVPMRPSDLPNMAAGPSNQSFPPRAFQQQASSMLQPPAPNSAQQPGPQSIMGPGNFGHLPPQTMGNEQKRFMSPGMMLGPPGRMMVNQQQAVGMIVNRQQPGLSSPAIQVPPNFPMSRMQAPSCRGAAGHQQFMRASSQPFSAEGTAEETAPQMQQQMMRPQQDARPPMQARMPPQMIRQNFPGAPHMASAQQNVPSPLMLPMPANQQILNRPPPGLPPQNFNRPQYDAAQPRMATTMQFGSPRPFGAGPQRPM